MKLSVGRRRKAGGPRLARHRFNPKGESLERRQLLASPIQFNPTGNGNPADTYAILAFYWAPGNSLAVSSVPLTVCNLPARLSGDPGGLNRPEQQ